MPQIIRPFYCGVAAILPDTLRYRQLTARDLPLSGNFVYAYYPPEWYAAIRIAMPPALGLSRVALRHSALF